MIYNFKALKTEIRNGWTGANRSLHRTPFEQKEKRLGNESQYNLGLERVLLVVCHSFLYVY
jgi:hypothetical protein